MFAACIFPDTNMDFVSANPNSHAVHFFEAFGMTRFDRCDCRTALLKANGVPESAWCSGAQDPTFGEGCPLPPLSALPRFMDPAISGYNFCGCQDGARDNKALFRIDDLYVEDLDRDSDNNPDVLYAALLLDMPNDATADAHLRVAYRTLLDPSSPLREVAAETDSLVPNADYLERPDVELRQIYLSNPDFDTVDLCNDAGIGTGRLSEGWHHLTIIVTDRPWLSVMVDEDPNAQPILKEGIPDVANSATWTTREYTFHCTDFENDPDCLCVDPD